MSLLKRVKTHCRGQTTSGQNTLALTVECIDHGFEHDDFTPLVGLVTLSEAAQARYVRAIVGKVVEGFKFRKSDKADFGMVFGKVKDANQGVDETEMLKIRDFVTAKKSIQSLEVKAYIKGEATETLFEARTVEQHEKSAEAWNKKHTKAEVAEKLLDIRRQEAAFAALLK